MEITYNKIKKEVRILSPLRLAFDAKSFQCLEFALIPSETFHTKSQAGTTGAIWR